MNLDELKLSFQRKKNDRIKEELIKPYKKRINLSREKRLELIAGEEKWRFENQKFLNIYALPGTKVICQELRNSYPHFIEGNDIFLEIKQEYTVKETFPFDSYTLVELEEIPGIYFNSICFKMLADNIEKGKLKNTSQQNEAPHGK